MRPPLTLLPGGLLQGVLTLRFLLDTKGYDQTATMSLLPFAFTISTYNSYPVTYKNLTNSKNQVLFIFKHSPNAETNSLHETKGFNCNQTIIADRFSMNRLEII